MKNLLISDAVRVDYSKSNYGRAFPETRGSGRTTAQALGALAVAVANPGKPARVEDHWGTAVADEHQAHLILSYAKKLGLDYIEVTAKGNKLFVTSNHITKG